MRKVLFLILLLLNPCGGKKESKTVTLMTYNVANCNFNKEDHTSSIARVIREYDASYVSFNELDSCNRRHNTYQLKELSKQIGDWKYAFGTAFKYKGGSYGNGVATSGDIVENNVLTLEKEDGKEQRSVVVVETEDLVFASVHVDFIGEFAPRHQMETINKWFEDKYGKSTKPVIICGDFNAEPDSEVIKIAKKKWNLLSVTDNTYPTYGPCKCIDYIFALKSAARVKVVSSKVVTDGTESLSDHFPLVVTLKY